MSVGNTGTDLLIFVMPHVNGLSETLSPGELEAGATLNIICCWELKLYTGCLLSMQGIRGSDSVIDLRLRDNGCVV